MRSRVVLAIVAVAFVAAPVAHAATLPDMPGMGVAEDAVSGRASTTTTTKSAPAPKPAVPGTPTTSDAKPSTSLAEAAKSLSKLPGTGVIPSLSKASANLTSSRSVIPGPDALVMLAAFGSFAALGALYMLRRLGRI